MDEVPEVLSLSGNIEEAVSFTCSTTRLMTLRARGIAAAPAAAPAAAATATRRVRVLAAFLPAAARFGDFRALDDFFAAPARRADPEERFFEDFFDDLAELRDDEALFFELFLELFREPLLELLLLELRFFEDFFEDFFEPFFDAIGSLLFKRRWGRRDLNSEVTGVCNV